MWRPCSSVQTDSDSSMGNSDPSARKAVTSTGVPASRDGAPAPTRATPASCAPRIRSGTDSRMSRG